MRKLFIAVLVTVTITASAFAKDTKAVNAVAVSNFKREFKKASDVSWTSGENYIKATFVVNNEKMEAFYNTDGEKIATSKAIAIEDLPVNAKRALAKTYDGYTVTQAIEFNGAEEDAYFISAQNAKESIILKVNSSNQLSVFSRIKK